MAEKLGEVNPYKMLREDPRQAENSTLPHLSRRGWETRQPHYLSNFDSESIF